MRPDDAIRWATFPDSRPFQLWGSYYHYRNTVWQSERQSHANLGWTDRWGLGLHQKAIHRVMSIFPVLVSSRVILWDPDPVAWSLPSLEHRQAPWRGGALVNFAGRVFRRLLWLAGFFLAPWLVFPRLATVWLEMPSPGRQLYATQPAGQVGLGYLPDYTQSGRQPQGLGLVIISNLLARACKSLVRLCASAELFLPLSWPIGLRLIIFFFLLTVSWAYFAVPVSIAARLPAVVLLAAAADFIMPVVGSMAYPLVYCPLPPVSPDLVEFVLQLRAWPSGILSLYALAGSGSPFAELPLVAWLGSAWFLFSCLLNWAILPSLSLAYFLLIVFGLVLGHLFPIYLLWRLAGIASSIFLLGYSATPKVAEQGAPIKLCRMEQLGGAGLRRPASFAMLGPGLDLPGTFQIWSLALPGSSASGLLGFFISPVLCGPDSEVAAIPLRRPSRFGGKWLPVHFGTKVAGSLMSAGHYLGPTAKYGHGLARQGIISYPGFDRPDHLQRLADGLARTGVNLPGVWRSVLDPAVLAPVCGASPSRRLLSALWAPGSAAGQGSDSWFEFSGVDNFLSAEWNPLEIPYHSVGQDLRAWGFVRRLIDSSYTAEPQAILSGLRLTYCSKLAELAGPGISTAEISCFPGYSGSEFGPDCIPGAELPEFEFPATSFRKHTLSSLAGPSDFRSAPAVSTFGSLVGLALRATLGGRQRLFQSGPEDYWDCYYLEQPSHWFLDETLTSFELPGFSGSESPSKLPHLVRPVGGTTAPPQDLRRISFLDIIRLKRGLPRGSPRPDLPAAGGLGVLPVRDISSLFQASRSMDLARLRRRYPGQADSSLSSQLGVRAGDMSSFYSQATSPRLVSDRGADYLRRLATPGTPLFFLASRWYVLWPWVLLSWLAKLLILLALPVLVFMLVALEFMSIAISGFPAWSKIRLLPSLALHAGFALRAAAYSISEFFWASFVCRSYDGFFGGLRELGKLPSLSTMGPWDISPISLYIFFSQVYCYWLLAPHAALLGRLLRFIEKPGKPAVPQVLSTESRLERASTAGQAFLRPEQQFVLWYLINSRLARTLRGGLPVAAASDGQRLRLLLADCGVAASRRTPEGLRLIGPSVQWDRFKLLFFPGPGGLRRLPALARQGFEAELQSLESTGVLGARLAAFAGWASIAAGAFCFLAGLVYSDWYTFFLFATGSDWLRLYSHPPTYVVYVFWLAPWILAMSFVPAVGRWLAGGLPPAGGVRRPGYGEKYFPFPVSDDPASDIYLEHEHLWSHSEEYDESGEEPDLTLSPWTEEDDFRSLVDTLTSKFGEDYPPSLLEYDDYCRLDTQRSVIGFGLPEFDQSSAQVLEIPGSIVGLPNPQRSGLYRLVGDLLVTLMPRGHSGGFYWPTVAGKISPDVIRPMLSEDPFALASFLEFADATMLLPSESGPARHGRGAEPVAIPWLLAGFVLLIGSVGSGLFTRPTPKHSREFATYVSLTQSPYPRAANPKIRQFFAGLGSTPGVYFQSRLPLPRHGLPPLNAGLAFGRSFSILPLPRFGDHSYRTNGSPEAMSLGYRYPVSLLPYYPVRQEIRRVRLGMLSKIRSSRRLRSWSLNARHKIDYRKSTWGGNLLRYPLSEPGLVPRRAQRSGHTSRIVVAHPIGSVDHWLRYTKSNLDGHWPRLRPMAFKFPRSYFHGLAGTPFHDFQVPKLDFRRAVPLQVDTTHYARRVYKNERKSLRMHGMFRRLRKRKVTHRSFMLHWDMANGLGLRLHKPRRLRSRSFITRRFYGTHRRRRHSRFNKRKSGHYLKNPHYFLEHLPARIQNRRRKRWEFPRVRLQRPEFVYPADFRHFYFFPKLRPLRKIDTARVREFIPLLRDRYRFPPDWSIPLLERSKVHRTRAYRRRVGLRRFKRLSERRIFDSSGFLGLPFPGFGNQLTREQAQVDRRTRKGLRRAGRRAPTTWLRNPVLEPLIHKKARKRKPLALGHHARTLRRWKNGRTRLDSIQPTGPGSRRSARPSEADIGLLSSSRRYVPRGLGGLPADVRGSHELWPLSRLAQSLGASLHKHRRPSVLVGGSIRKPAYLYQHARRHRGRTHKTAAYSFKKKIGKRGAYRVNVEYLPRRQRKPKGSKSIVLPRSRSYMAVDKSHGELVPAWHRRRFKHQKWHRLFGTVPPRSRRGRSRGMRTRLPEADVTAQPPLQWPVPDRLAWSRHGTKKPRLVSPELPNPGPVAQRSFFSASEMTDYWNSSSALLNISVPLPRSNGSSDLSQFADEASPPPPRVFPGWAHGSLARRSRPSVSYGQASKGVFKPRGLTGRRKINRYGNSSSFGSPRLSHFCSLLPGAMEQVLVGAASCWVELFHSLWWTFADVALALGQPSSAVLFALSLATGMLSWIFITLAGQLSALVLDMLGILSFLIDLPGRFLAIGGWHTTRLYPYPSDRLARRLL